MSTLVTAVWMVLVFAAGTVALAGLWVVLLRADEPGHSEAVLPSHYSSLLHATPSNHPGYCPECGTNNDPEHGLCRNCSARLPARRTEHADDAERIFRS